MKQSLQQLGEIIENGMKALQKMQREQAQAPQEEQQPQQGDDGALEAQKLQFEREKHDQDMAMKQQKHEQEMAFKFQDAALKGKERDAEAASKIIKSPIE
jgi:hypothetical protein